MTIERRKYIRFLAKREIFAALRSGFEKVGRVLDISINGLSFIYVLEESISEEPFQVDIFQSNNGFYLSNIPCRVVYDIPIINKKYDLLIQPRQCGLCFGGLSKKQEDDLLTYINKSTNMAGVKKGASGVIEPTEF